MWTQLFSIITVGICAFIVFRNYPSEFNDNKYISIASLTVWVLGDILIHTNLPFRKFLSIFLQSVSLSLLLTIFLIFIRQRKPVVFRYPYYMVFIPILIPFSQFIIMDTPVIQDIIFMTLQGVSILVFSLLAIAYDTYLNNKIVLIIGILLLFSGFIFYWILQENYIVFDWAWALTNSIGMIACIYSFSDLLKS